MGTELVDPKISGYVRNWPLLGMPRRFRKFAFGSKILGKVLKSWYLEKVHGCLRTETVFPGERGVVIRLVVFSRKSSILNEIVLFVDAVCPQNLVPSVN